MGCANLHLPSEERFAAGLAEWLVMVTENRFMGMKTRQRALVPPGVRLLFGHIPLMFVYHVSQEMKAPHADDVMDAGGGLEVPGSSLSFAAHQPRELELKWDIGEELLKMQMPCKC